MYSQKIIKSDCIKFCANIKNSYDLNLCNNCINCKHCTLCEDCENC